MKFDWSDYISAQRELAEILLAKADQFEGADAVALHGIAQSRLMEIGLLGQSKSDDKE